MPRARPCAGAAGGADAPANGADAVFGTLRGAFCFLGLVSARPAPQRGGIDRVSGHGEMPSS